MKNCNRLKPGSIQRNEDYHNGKYVAKQKIFFSIFKFL